MDDCAVRIVQAVGCNGADVFGFGRVVGTLLQKLPGFLVFTEAQQKDGFVDAVGFAEIGIGFGITAVHGIGDGAYGTGLFLGGKGLAQLVGPFEVTGLQQGDYLVDLHLQRGFFREEGNQQGGVCPVFPVEKGRQVVGGYQQIGMVVQGFPHQFFLFGCRTAGMAADVTPEFAGSQFRRVPAVYGVDLGKVEGAEFGVFVIVFHPAEAGQVAVADQRIAFQTAGTPRDLIVLAAGPADQVAQFGAFCRQTVTLHGGIYAVPGNDNALMLDAGFLQRGLPDVPENGVEGALYALAGQFLVHLVRAFRRGVARDAEIAQALAFVLLDAFQHLAELVQLAAVAAVAFVDLVFARTEGEVHLAFLVEVEGLLGRCVAVVQLVGSGVEIEEAHGIDHAAGNGQGVAVFVVAEGADPDIDFRGIAVVDVVHAAGVGVGDQLVGVETVDYLRKAGVVGLFFRITAGVSALDQNVVVLSVVHHRGERGALVAGVVDQIGLDDHARVFMEPLFGYPVAGLQQQLFFHDFQLRRLEDEFHVFMKHGSDGHFGQEGVRRGQRNGQRGLAARTYFQVFISDAGDVEGGVV